MTRVNRIATVFSRLHSAAGKALIPYVTPEYPLRGITVPLLSSLADAGADLIEVGVPFSDPLADGPTIQRSSEISLRNGATIPVILKAVEQFRSRYETPVLLMGYVNPLLRYGLDGFLRDAVNAGVDGLILPDLPPEEASILKQKCVDCGISTVFLIAPTSSPKRMKIIDESSTHVSYCVSVTGVTGARAGLGANGSLRDFLAAVRMHTKKPFVVGFGISTAEQVRTISQWADGVVVGSALLNAIGRETDSKAVLQGADRFFRSLRQPA